MTPLRRVGRALRAAGAIFGSAAIKTMSGIALVPGYLSNLLWLISQQFLDLTRNGYAANSAVYAVMRVLWQSIAEPPLVAYTVSGDGETETPLPYAHPLRQLIRRPNELMSESQMWALVEIQTCIVGRSLWWKERNHLGQVIALWPLRPDRCGPIYSDKTTPGESILSGWSYLVPGTGNYINLPRRDVLCFLWPDPAGESGGIVEGLGPLQVLSTEVAADNQATTYVGSLLANYATPGVVIQVQGSLRDENDARLIKENFKRDFGGVSVGTPAVIDAGSTVTAIGFSLQDLEFPALRRVSESRIAAAFGVPAILVGLQVGLESGIRATIAEQREYFAETTLSTHWRAFADQFTHSVASETGLLVVCRFDLTKVRALALQAQGEIEKIAQGYQLGVVSVDEYRDKVLQLPPLGGEAGTARLLTKGSTLIDAEGQPVAQPVDTALADQPASGDGGDGAGTGKRAA